MQLQKLSQGIATITVTHTDARFISRALHLAAAEFTTEPEMEDIAVSAIETAFKAIALAGTLQMTARPTVPPLNARSSPQSYLSPAQASG